MNDLEGDETVGSGGFNNSTFLFSMRKPRISDRFNQVRLLGSATAGKAGGTKAKQNTKANSLAAEGLG